MKTQILVLEKQQSRKSAKYKRKKKPQVEIDIKPALLKGADNQSLDVKQ